ncbi:hypothetical protein J437_LFUL016753 [Ladona fulva]|uniref:Mos1 transposase HTH domain-containing protein n=1 Tax=Ladona fulva TaxID=123851 RepID=A0A8K0JVC6_LADFU|nr:hypothetical protein J437_LFUL016753 [Ladona fulva]
MDESSSEEDDSSSGGSGFGVQLNVSDLLFSVYGKGVMSESMVRRWVCEFKVGRHSLEDKSGRGRPSLVIDELVVKVDNAVCEDRCFTMDELHECFSEVS